MGCANSPLDLLLGLYFKFGYLVVLSSRSLRSPSPSSFRGCVVRYDVTLHHNITLL